MTTVIDLSVERSVMLNLGRVGENNITEFVFDYSNWAEEFGEGTLSLVLKRQGDEEGYPKSMTTENLQSTWIVDQTDVANEGIGEAQLTYTVNSEIKKSVIYLTKTCPSIEPVGPAPDPYQSWLDQMVDVKESADDAADRAEEFADRAEEAAETFDTTGYFPDMTVGYADNLVSSSYVSDSEPYLFRKTFAGVREDDELGGGSVVWNQLCNSASVTIPNGRKYFMKKGTDYSIGASTGTAITGLTSGSDMVIDLTLMFGPTVADYIYTVEQATAGAGVAFFRSLFSKPYYAYNAGTLMSVKTSAHKMVGFNQWDEEWEVGGLSTSTGAPIASTNSIRSKNFIPCLQTTYYLWSTNPASYVWFYDSSQTFISFSTGTHNRTFVPPANACYMKILLGDGSNQMQSYDNGTCLNFSDPSKNGTYEPYTSVTYPLSSIGLRGIPTIVDGKLKYDGDVYNGNKAGTITYATENMEDMAWSANGTSGSYYEYAVTIEDKAIGGTNVYCTAYPTAISAVSPNTIRGRASTKTVSVLVSESTLEAFLASVTGHKLWYQLETPITQKKGGMRERHYALTDLGSINWYYSDTADNPYFYSSNIPDKAGGNWNVLCPKYALTAGAATTAMKDKEIKGHATSKAIFIKDSAYTDATAFKASLAGVLLLYELATPTIESADPYTNPQVCYPDGTEEYIDTREVPIPVGHNTKYMRDLKKLLEGIPDAPSADGTYTLKVTVSNGVATYSWG